MITQEQIKATIERAEKQIEEMKELLQAVDTGQGRVPKGELYWVVYSDGAIGKCKEDGHFVDDLYFESGNYYLTLEDAERAEKQIRLFRLLDRFSRQNGWIDEIWKDDEADKWYIWMDYNANKLRSSAITYNRDICQVYFTSESVAQQAIKKYHDLIMEVMAI